MRMTDNALQALVAMALEDDHDESRSPVIQKELLHYDILFCLSQAGLLDGLVFQGGTSLRLCYGSGRYSEDLDFVGGRDFTSSTLTGLKDRIKAYLEKRYGLDVTVKEPAALRKEPAYAALNVDRWQVSIVTDPGRRDRPRQRTRIEIANVPAYVVEDRKLQANYRFLPDGYRDVRLAVESMDEIMADKLVALVTSQKYVRHRDIWDLAWLRERGATIRPDLVERKIEDYRESDYSAKLDLLIKRVPSMITDAFREEMERFLRPDVYDRTLANPGYRHYTRAVNVEIVDWH